MEPFRIHIIPGNHRHLKSVCVKSNWWKLKLALQILKFSEVIAVPGVWMPALLQSTGTEVFSRCC